MKNIAQVFLQDMRRVSQNMTAMIVVFGLIVIPSLFTWFNVIASWNPFENTKGLTVAVANSDEGHESELFPLRINVGEQVLSALRANDDLDWVVTTEEEAIEGTQTGEYYAAIVMPKDFSTRMLSFYAHGSERTEIEYYTNEKKNALAPKITEQGAGTVSRQINEAFTKTLNEVGLTVINSLSSYIDDADTQIALSKMQAHVGEISAQLKAGAETAQMFSTLIGASTSLVTSAADIAEAAGSSLREVADASGTAVQGANELKNTVDVALSALGQAFSSSAESYGAVADKLNTLYGAADQQAGSLASTTTAAAKSIDTHIANFTSVRNELVNSVGPILPPESKPGFDAVVKSMDRAIDRQQAASDRLHAAAKSITDSRASQQQTKQDILALVNEAKGAVQDAADAYSKSLEPKLQQLAATLTDVKAGVSSVGADLSSLTNGLSGAGSLVEALTSAEETTAEAADNLTEVAERFDKLSKALEKSLDSGDLTAISDVIGANPEMLAAVLSEPASFNRIPVFEVASFGTAMAPLYTVLALWVGALLAAVSIRVGVSRHGMNLETPLTPTQTYIGRYGIFALVGLFQSTVLCLGLMLFVQVQPAHPFLLVFAGWVISTVFTMLIYTLVVAFGNAGKAIAVLLLVIQISSSGGAYPLQLLPQWFQNISPFLPATHAVSALRSALAGTYQGDFWISIGSLALFLVPTLLLGLVLRRPLMKGNQKLIEAIESTRLM